MHQKKHVVERRVDQALGLDDIAMLEKTNGWKLFSQTPRLNFIPMGQDMLSGTTIKYVFLRI